MKLFDKLKKKLGILAVFGLLLQTALPIYQNAAFAMDGSEEHTQEEVINEDERTDDKESDSEKEKDEENHKESNNGAHDAEEKDPEDSKEADDSEKVNGEKESEDHETSFESEEDQEETDEDVENDSDLEDDEERTELGNLKGEEDQEKNTTNDSDEEIINEEKNKKDQSNQLAEEKHGFILELNNATDLEGNPFDDDHHLELDDEFYLDLAWNLEDGHNYKEGDTETFELPHGIKIQEEFEIELKSDGLDVAKAIIKTDGTVELTFTDFVETHSKVKGQLQIVSMIDEENAEEENGEIVLNPIGDEGEIRIPIDLGDREKTIEKEGTPNKGYNADEINWEVIINKQKNNLSNAIVTDVLPEGTEFKEGSLKVTKLNVDLKGNIKGDLEEVDITGDSVEDGTLNIPLGDIKDAYRLEYTTNVTDDEQKKFRNNVTLSDNDLDDVSANSTATINRGDPIKKSAATGYDPKDGTIDWELEFNFNQKDLEEVTLKDAWTPEGKMHLVEDSLKFQEVSIDEDGKAHNEGDPINLPEGAELVNGDDQFEVTGISTDKAYKVTYQTKINDRVLDDFKISNTAGFGSESDDSGEGVGTYYGSKSAGNVDYSNKTIDWTIELNHDEYPMEKISIEDTLGDGLTLDEESIEITVDGNEYEGDYTVSGDNPFELTFDEDFTTDKKIVIKYKTDFIADDVTNNLATNKADLTWTPEGGSDSITKEVKAETPLNEETEDNSWKNGSYDPDTKEITWTIFTNYRENSLDNLIVTDEPQGNQQIVEDSAVVKELEIASNGDISEGDTLDNVSTIDVDNNTLDVNIGETDKAYKIEYKTSLEGLSDIQKEYVNQAEVFDGDNSLSEIDAKVGIAKAHTYAAKSGEQDGKQVHWAVTVNPGQQKVQNLKLEDKVSDNQDILSDTFNVYEADVDGNGNATKKEEPISSDRYELTHEEGEPTFTVEWNDTVERAFVVEYSTLFFAGHNENVTNSYDVTGDNIVDDGNTDGSGSVKIKQFGSGSGEGTAGYLVIDKVDTTHDQEESKLEGAEFDLIDADTGNVLKSGITDENGQIDFGRLLFGDYELKETTVPEDYVTPKETQTITIDKAYDSTKDKADYLYEVENYIPVFAVELSKTGKDNEALKGAEFTLFDSDDNKLQTKETDEDGNILFEDLENAGDYYIQETKAPAGYVLDEKKYNLTIGNKEPEPVKVSVKNKERGAVQLTKTDQDTGEALEGVEFVLQKENDSGGYDTVKIYTTDENGRIKTSNRLEAGNYQFVEEESLDGYRTDGKPVKFTVNVNSTKTQKLTMANEQYKGAVKLIKKDAATNDNLEGAEFKLVDVDGETVEENLSTNKKGEITVNDLFLGDYQLIETKAPESYELNDTPIDVEITEDNEVVEKTMTNNKVMNISVEKDWNNDGGETEDVTIKLLPTNETIQLNEENDWEATFEGLDVYDESGEEIDYQIKELTVDGFNSSITGNASDGFMVTNTETTNVSGEKTWLDEHAEDRPETIEIELLANNEKIDETKITAQSNSDYSFTNLDKYDENGDEITYTIDEVNVDGYETNINGYDIENVRKATTSVKGEKTWKEEDPTDRPDSITVNLLQNGDEIASKEVQPTVNGNWNYQFTDLDEFDENGVAYDYIIEEDNVPENYESTVDGYNITNIRVGKTELSGTKRWKDDTVEDRPVSIKVNLLRNDVVIETEEVTADDNWDYEFTELDKYDKDGKYYDYTVKEQDVPGYSSEVDGKDITNTRSEQKDIEITKGWLDNDSKDRPDSVIVHVYQNDELFDTVKVKASDDWVYELTDVEAYDEDGQPYKYTIREKDLEGYESTVDGFNITNLRVGETEISGEKIWKDNDDVTGDRPKSITVNLLQNGEKVNSKEVTEEENWEYSFEELDKYDDQGVEYGYTIDEEDIEGYEKSGDGQNLTNTRIGRTKVHGEKIWQDNDNATEDRPDSITVNLLQNGRVFASEEVTADNDWEYSFNHLPRFDENGVEWGYTVDEENVDGYEKSAGENNDLINTRVGTTEITGKKIWQDNDDATGDRPDSITVKLLQNGRVFTEAEATAENNWTYSFDNLPRFNEKGVEYGYTVDEVVVDGYKKSAGENNDLINTRTGMTEITGEKVWQDNEDATGDRPDSITVKLLQNGRVFAETEVTAENDWTYNFDNLSRFDEEGTEYGYTVDETDVDGYKKSNSGTDLINTRTGKIEVTVDKSWVDEDEINRPDTITVNLLQNGTVFTTETIEADADGNWAHTFAELPEFDDKGKLHEYSVTEQDVPGYDSDVDGFDIRNTRSEEKSIKITKSWLDDNSDDRPDSIGVELYRSITDGEKELVDTYEVKDSDDWSLEVTNLPAFDSNGKAYAYEIDEKAVEGYNSKVNGFDITNTRIGKKEINVNKVWENDTEENRPDNIEVNLIQNGEVIETVELSKENDWSHRFTNLDEFDTDGKAYDYTIKEKAVENYETKIKEIEHGFEIRNIYTDTEEPSDPSTPEEPTDPKDPDTPELEDPDKPGLPQTGEATKTVIYVLGALLIFLGLGIGKKQLEK